VSELVKQGAAKIGILPYFLFPGGITDAIDDLVTQLRKQFPTTNLLLEGAMLQGSSLANGTNPGLMETIGEILLSAEN
jgi:sirohydrochlorin ferrochelatase